MLEILMLEGMVELRDVRIRELEKELAESRWHLEVAMGCVDPDEYNEVLRDAKERRES
jgi:hypothetical protein